MSDEQRTNTTERQNKIKNINKELAEKALEGHEFSTGRDYDESDYDDDSDIDDEESEKLDQEVDDMIKIWNRTEILKEVEEERKRQKIKDQKIKYEDYYDGKTSFDELEKAMDPLGGSSHVFIKFIKSNPDGQEIKPLNTILVEYMTFLEFEDTPLESTHHDGKPKKIDLAEGPLFPGFLRGLLSMREGEVANLLVKPSMISGPLPPLGFFNGRTLDSSVSFYYHITVLKIITDSNLDNIIKFEDEYNIDFPLEQKLKYINEHKEVANKLSEEHPREALIRYKAAITVLDDVDYDELMDNDNLKQLLLTLLQNAGIIFNRLNMHKAATKYFKRALFVEPKSIKILYQIAKARIALKDYDRALKWIEQADKISPNHNHIRELKKQINRELSNEYQKRNEIMLKMSKAFK